MEYQNLLIEKADGIATITINRPKALNALNHDTLVELASILGELDQDEETQVLIITGAGEKAFVAGADISAMQSLDAATARRFARLGHGVMNAIEKFPKPVIAAVNGFALGGGCEVALACDIRIAGEKARFGQPEVNLGVIPGFGGTQRLPRLIGKGRAKELIFTGEMIDAQEAYRIGLVNKVTTQEDLLPAAREMARKIVSKGQVAVRISKEVINNGLDMDQDKAGQYEADLFGLCFSTADQKEGMSAFLEKRPAKFTGA